MSISVGEKVVHKKWAFGDVLEIDNGKGTLRVMLDFDRKEVISPITEWKSAYIIEDFVFDIEKATLPELREMLARAQAIRVAEPSKGKKTREKNATAKSNSVMAMLSPELQAKLKAMGI